MKLSYSRPDKSYPALTRLKPPISEAERSLMKTTPPPALPAHCKPWVEAQSYGVLMVFPHPITLTLEGREGAPPAVHISPSALEEDYSSIISSFSLKHVGLATDYRIKTEPGIGTYVNSLPSEYRPKAELIRGLVETWWYPQHLFLVFNSPKPGETITFERGDPLCVLMPVICEALEVEELSEAEEDAISREQQQYKAYVAQASALSWTSAEGNGFSRAYKAYSKRYSLSHSDR